jgi:hypothetical protein
MGLLDQAKKAGETTDQTEAKAGYDYAPPPEGFTPARFMGYVEIGNQPQKPYKGKEKPPAMVAILTFELNGPKHITEYEVDGEKRTRTNIITERVKVSSSERSGFYKLLKKMIGGRPDIKHMAEMLGEGFLIKIVHNVVEKDGKKRTYVNMKSEENGWEIRLPQKTDPITNEVEPVDIPAATIPLKFLNWEAPTPEQWESIFIDGTYTTKDEDGKEVEKSKNFIQGLCMEATNFIGSPLEAMLSGGDDIVKELSKPETPETPETAEEEEEIPTVPEETSVDKTDDVLADLGLG